MKGLILKDLMCLRKQLITFLYVAAGVLILSVLYVLSTRFGNLALAEKQLLAMGGLESTDVRNLFSIVLLLFMMLPLACLEDVTILFAQDRMSGFAGYASCLPLSPAQCLLSRYLTVIICLGLGILVDFLYAILLSNLTELMHFSELCGGILSEAGILCIISSLSILFSILLGSGKEQYALILSLLLTCLGILSAARRKLAVWLAGSEAALFALPQQLLDFIRYKPFLIPLAALITMAGTYGLSYLLIRKRRCI